MKPWIGVAFYSLSLHGAASLKDRRQVVRSLTDRAKRHFNVSIADLGPDACDRADLAFSGVGSSASEVRRRMSKLDEFIRKIEADGQFEIANACQEVFSYGDF